MRYGIAALLLATTASQVLAADADWRSCRSLAEAGERLACYDRAVDAAVARTATPTAPAPAVVAPVAVAPVTAPAAAMAPNAPAPASAAPAVAATNVAATTRAPATSVTVPAPRQQTAAEFGLEHQATTELEQIVSRIPGEFRGWEAKSRITLENGQVWQIIDGTRGVYLLDNPTVTIERGALGSFRMCVEGANRTPKVRRVK